MIKKTIIISSLVMLAACQARQKQQTTAGPAATDSNVALSLDPGQIQRAGIQTGYPELRQIQSSLHVNGTVEASPEHRHTISFPMGGFVRSSILVAGMPLKKGAVMATLEDQGFIQLQQDYLTAKAKLAFAKADYERQLQLNASESNSQRVLQQATADYETQKILVSGLAEKLRLIGILPETLTEQRLSRTVVIRAPISGYISKVNVNPGKYVTPGDVLFELIDPSDVHISLMVFEQDAYSLQTGQKVLCTTNNDPHKIYTASIEYIAPDLDEHRAVEVHCHLQQPTHLLPGNFISADIETAGRKVPALPDDGIVKWQGRNYVFSTTDRKTFRMMAVETGASSEGYTEIKTKLPASLLVTGNAYALLTMLKNTPDE